MILHKRFYAFLSFLASLVLASGVFAQIVQLRTGFVDSTDCGLLTNPAINTLICLQTANSPTRVAGTLYVWNGTAWTPFITGSGITSLGGLAGASQTFANDTNVTITSSGTTHTLGWTGSLAVARGGTGSTTASGARTNLGLAIGTDVQAANSNLSALASTASTGIYKITGVGTSGIAAFADVVSLFGGGSCGSNFLKGDGTCASGSVTETDPVVKAISGLVKSNGSTISAAVAGTDYVAPDAELTALAGLTSAANKLPYFTGSGTASTTDFTAYARTLLDDADAATARTTLGLGSIATQASSSVTITGGSITGITDLAVADGGTGSSTASGARTNLGLAIGTDVQAFNANLAAISGLTSATDKLPYFTGSGTAATADFTAFARTLLDDASATVARTTLGLAIGTDVPAFSVTVKNNASNTYSTGDQDFSAASSLKTPVATGAAPTISGRIAYDSTSNRFKGGVNGTTQTFAYLSEVQPLATNLTALAAISGASNGVPVFTGSSTMALAVIPSCLDSAGQHLNWDATSHAWACGTSSTGGLSGATTGKYLLATGATTFDTSGNLSETAGVVNALGGLTVGNVSTNKFTIDPSAVTGFKTMTVQNQSGTLLLGNAAGTFTTGHVITASVSGGIVTLADGGAAGAGTWTDSSTSTGTNKTIDVEATGNVITTVAKIWLPAAGGTAAAPSLLWDTLATNAPTASCSAGSTETTLLRCTADFPDSDGDFSLQQAILLPSDWTGNVDLKFLWRAAATSGDVVWQAALVCRADGEVDDATFNTSNTVVDTAKGTTNQLNTASIASMTTTGCSAGELAHLKIFRNRTHASDTIAGTVSLVGVEVTARRAQ